VIVRAALPGEADAVGALRVAAYQAQDLLHPEYADTLRMLGFGGQGTVLVAADGEELLGTVMLEPWHAGSEVARRPDEVEVRALAVAPSAQGHGAGRALMLAVINAAAASGARRLLLSTRPEMKAARHVYQSLGFTRAPELDWAPVPDVTLHGFALALERTPSARVSPR
jgi:ribosomal protein S18 acetylase RimI-like enzyme